MTRTVLITGANRGIGLELARQLTARGDRVFGSARESEPASLLGVGPAGCVQMDLADENSINAAMAELATQTQRLDWLINCAGIDARATGGALDARGPFDVTAQTFTDVSVVNVTGPMVVTREALPLLREADGAFIFNVSSQLGSMEFAANAGSDTAYCVSKAALNMLTVKTASVLRPDGIGALMVHPGWVSSDMGGERAPMTPTESAAAMIETFSGVDLGDSGRFVRWDGTTHPW